MNTATADLKNKPGPGCRKSREAGLRRCRRASVCKPHVRHIFLLLLIQSHTCSCCKVCSKRKRKKSNTTLKACQFFNSIKEKLPPAPSKKSVPPVNNFCLRDVKGLWTTGVCNWHYRSIFLALRTKQKKQKNKPDNIWHKAQSRLVQKYGMEKQKIECWSDTGTRWKKAEKSYDSCSKCRNISLDCKN